MLFDYSLLPPEVNSTRMYGGPGAGSMQAAAASWDSLSAELRSTANTYDAVIVELAGMQWLGPAAAAMTASAAPYIGWLYGTAELTKQTAMQATAAAAAFEQAHAMTVPPPLVLANRLQLELLIATNFFGQNSGAIAATEALYAEMWAIDAAAMYDYASASSEAAALVPFDAPESDTVLEGLQAQNNAVTGAVAEANQGLPLLREILDAIKVLLTQLSPELRPVTELMERIYGYLPAMVKDDFSIFEGVLGSYAAIGSVNSLGTFITSVMGAESSVDILPSLAESAEAAVAPDLLAVLNTNAGLMSGGGSQVSNAVVGAAISNAGRIGQMSVPHAWAATEVNAVRAVEGTPLTTVAIGDGGVAPNSPMMPAVPVGATGRTAAVPRYGSRLTVMTRPLSGG